MSEAGNTANGTQASPAIPTNKPGSPEEPSKLSALPRAETSRDFTLKIWDRILKTIATLALVLGGLIGLWKYLDQRRTELDLKQHEYELLLHNERKEMYHPLCKAAGEIASANSLAEAEPAIKTFFALYYGEVHIVATAEVIQAKEMFAKEVEDFRRKSADEAPHPELIQACVTLANTCRQSLDLDKLFNSQPSPGH
jgi:hypothetical protein